jgi:azurin
MKIRFALIPLVAAFIVAGCGQKDASTASGTAAAGAPAGPREIDLTANDTMKYDVTALQAKPGEDLKVVLTNAGTTPIEAMGHNWVLLKAGSDAAAFSSAAVAAKATNYIPANLQDQIVAKIDLLGPHKSGEVDFKAPTTPGDYPYLCTFPAHYQVGMHGILTVK